MAGPPVNKPAMYAATGVTGAICITLLCIGWFYRPYPPMTAETHDGLMYSGVVFLFAFAICLTVSVLTGTDEEK